jgi:hypothetical protein
MQKIDIPTLKAENLVLRTAVLSDAQFIVGLVRDPTIHRMYGGSAASLKPPYSEAEAHAWVNNAMEDPCTWLIDVGTVI